MAAVLPTAVSRPIGASVQIAAFALTAVAVRTGAFALTAVVPLTEAAHLFEAFLQIVVSHRTAVSHPAAECHPESFSIHRVPSQFPFRLLSPLAMPAHPSAHF